MKNNLSIFNNLRPITVGFDNMFDHFEHMLDDGGFFRNGTVSNFPPYNIVKTGKNNSRGTQRKVHRNKVKQYDR